nr:tRNA (adenosine(37)-N6)-threonylcarbamoyltransferase complex transferase subunit TsaD [Spirochaetota bacterium]
SRLHLKKIFPITLEALEKANKTIREVDLIAVANRPGLIGGLVVGLSFAKSLAFMNDIPFIGVNHIEAHLYSPNLGSDIEFPYIGLLASGGHTLIVKALSFTKYEILGTTIDDAAGEAFDKIAKHYDMGYPGGPSVEKLAAEGDDKAFNFPLSNLYKSDRKYDVSYSGLKTAVINHLEKYRKKENYTINDIAASFQKRAFDSIIKKTMLAAKDNAIKTIVVAGGVSANKCLRRMFSEIKGYEVFFPDLKYATDNGAMIAGYAYHKYKESGKDDYDLAAFPRVDSFKISLSENYR